jgi:hypothetical protein
MTMSTQERGPAKGQPKPDRGTQGAAPAARQEGSRRPGSTDQVQQTLDDALADSFPASDPVSIVTSQHGEAWDDQGRAKE